MHTRHSGSGDCVSQRKHYLEAGADSQSFRPSVARSFCNCCGSNFSNTISLAAAPAGEGWSLSKRADSDCVREVVCVARAAKDDVASWYLVKVVNVYLRR